MFAKNLKVIFYVIFLLGFKFYKSIINLSFTLRI